MGTKVLEEIYEALDTVHRECIQTTIVSRSGRWDAQKFKGTLEEMVSLNSETPVKTPALIYLRMEC